MLYFEQTHIYQKWFEQSDINVALCITTNSTKKLSMHIFITSRLLDRMPTRNIPYISSTMPSAVDHICINNSHQFHCLELEWDYWNAKQVLLVLGSEFEWVIVQEVAVSGLADALEEPLVHSLASSRVCSSQPLANTPAQTRPSPWNTWTDRIAGVISGSIHNAMAGSGVITRHYMASCCPRDKRSCLPGCRRQYCSHPVHIPKGP